MRKLHEKLFDIKLKTTYEKLYNYNSFQTEKFINKFNYKSYEEYYTIILYKLKFE